VALIAAVVWDSIAPEHEQHATVVHARLLARQPTPRELRDAERGESAREGQRAASAPTRGRDVRRSTLQRVERNVEAAGGQYPLRERASEPGWRANSVFMVDGNTCPLGGTSMGRIGVSRIVAEVGARSCWAGARA
jgi:hypothetical protein